MAISSYQTLARYHDGRQSNRMPDIRQQLRRDIFSSRSETKLAQLFKNRRLYDPSGNDLDDEYSYDLDDCGYDEVDCRSFTTEASEEYQSSWLSPTSWHTPAQVPSSNAPSPSLSHDSDYCSSNSSLHQRDNFKTARPRPSIFRSRKEILELRKRVKKSCYSDESVRFEYQTLKRNIVGGSADQETIGFIISSSWTVLSNAINSHDENLSRDALNFLTQLILHRLVKITDILFILQQGLILTIKDTISRLGSQQADVVALLISIIFVEPRAASYMIELIVDTDIVRLLEDFIEFGTAGEVLLATKFYSCLFDIEIELFHRGNYTPVVPNTISRSTSTTELAKIYCPATSLKRIIRPNFVSSLIGRFFKSTGDVEEDLTMVATVITANCLKLVHANSYSEAKDMGWVRSVMAEFESNKFDQLLEKLVRTYTNSQCSSRKLDIVKWLSSLYSEMSTAISSQSPLLTNGDDE